MTLDLDRIIESYSEKPANTSISEPPLTNLQVSILEGEELFPEKFADPYMLREESLSLQQSGNMSENTTNAVIEEHKNVSEETVLQLPPIPANPEVSVNPALFVHGDSGLDFIEDKFVEDNITAVGADLDIQSVAQITFEPVVESKSDVTFQQNNKTALSGEKSLWEPEDIENAKQSLAQFESIFAETTEIGTEMAFHQMDAQLSSVATSSEEFIDDSRSPMDEALLSVEEVFVSSALDEVSSEESSSTDEVPSSIERDSISTEADVTKSDLLSEDVSIHAVGVDVSMQESGGGDNTENHGDADMDMSGSTEMLAALSSELQGKLDFDDNIEPQLEDQQLLEEIKNIPDRLAFKIGDVAEIVGVKQYVLRYWETEFEILKPKKSRQNQRMYTRKDIENILLIKKLLYRDKFSIEGARRAVKTLKAQVKESKQWDQVMDRYDHAVVQLQGLLNEIRDIKTMFR